MSVTVDTSVSRGAARALLERCSVAVSRCCVVKPVGERAEREEEDHEKRESRTEKRRNQKCQRCGPLDVGDVAAAVAKSFGAGADVRRKGRISMWTRNNALRCVGVGDGVALAVSDGELVLVCAQEHALGLPIAGQKPRRRGGQGGQTALLRLGARGCERHAAVLRDSLRDARISGILCRDDDTSTDDISLNAGILATAAMYRVRRVNRVPALERVLDSAEDSRSASSALAVYDWLASIILTAADGSCDNGVVDIDSFVDGIDALSMKVSSTECFGADDDGASALEYYEWGALTPPRTISACFDTLVRHVDQGNVPWSALTLWGFRDSPVFESGKVVARAREELGFREWKGDPTLTVIVFRSPSMTTSSCVLLRSVQ